MVVRFTEPLRASVPPLHAPFTPTLLEEETAPIGAATFTPEYRETEMTALCSATSKLAVTTPSPVGVPRALQTSTIVWLRRPH